MLILVMVRLFTGLYENSRTIPPVSSCRNKFPPELNVLVIVYIPFDSERTKFVGVKVHARWATTVVPLRASSRIKRPMLSYIIWNTMPLLFAPVPLRSLRVSNKPFAS